MASQNVRMHGPAQVSNVAVVKYTAPAGQQAILQHIHAQNPSNAGVTFTLSIGVDGATTRVYDAFTIGAGQVLDVFCKYVLSAGESIQAFAGANNVLTLTLDGQAQNVLPVGSAAPFNAIYEVDFTTLPAQAMQAAGSYVIDGKTWWAKGPQQTTTFAIVPGEGIKASFPNPPAISANWRADAGAIWNDRLWSLPLSQLPGFNPDAPIACLWRATGNSQSSAGEPAIYGGLCDMAANSIALQTAERATSFAVGHFGTNNIMVICAPHNNSGNSGWNALLANPLLVPANTMDGMELGVYKLAANRFFPLAKHFTGALGNPSSSSAELGWTTAEDRMRTGNGQSSSPSFFFLFQSAGNPGIARIAALTHLKILQPKT
jgi:hypothetical protein